MKCKMICTPLCPYYHGNCPYEGGEINARHRRNKKDRRSGNKGKTD